eukprot:5408980-Lingulodinium_polyedra.AAC.1
MIKRRLPWGVLASTRRRGSAPFRRRSQTSSVAGTCAVVPPPMFSQRSQVFFTVPAKVGSISTKKLACKAPGAPTRRR